MNVRIRFTVTGSPSRPVSKADIVFAFQRIAYIIQDRGARDLTFNVIVAGVTLGLGFLDLLPLPTATIVGNPTNATHHMPATNGTEDDNSTTIILLPKPGSAFDVRLPEMSDGQDLKISEG